MATKKSAKPETDSRYVVQPGDTEFTIAQHFQTSVGLLRQLNKRLQGSYAQVGRKIYIK